MELLKNESLESEYKFKKSKKKIYLSDKRIIIEWKNNQESYPLDKVTSVKFGFNRNNYFLFGSLVLIFVVFVLVFMKDSLTVIFPWELIGIIAAGLALTAIVYFWVWFIGGSNLIISQFGGERIFKIPGKQEDFKSFVDKINEKLF
ncbi:MAG: hypothetical protein GQ564_12375 [Bacteroidales bacterium]|nr:hypothetical protein [Bacteroidales bacterium]